MEQVRERRSKRAQIVGCIVFSILLLNSQYLGIDCYKAECGSEADVKTDVNAYIEQVCPKTVLVEYESTEYAAPKDPSEITKLLYLNLAEEPVEDNSFMILPTEFPESETNTYLSELFGITEGETNSETVSEQVMTLDVIQIENDLILSEIETAMEVYREGSIENSNLAYIANTLMDSSELAYNVSETIKNGNKVADADVDTLIRYEQYKEAIYDGGEIQPLDNPTDKYSRVKENVSLDISKDLDLETGWKDISDEKRERMNKLCTGVPMYSTSEVINKMVADVINTYCTDDMTPADKAYTCYKYIMANTKYSKYTYSKTLRKELGVGGDGEWIDTKGKVQWTKRRPQSYAVARIYSMLSDSIKKGACDNYAAATTACFRALGFDARVVAKSGVHFWCEVVDPNTGDSYVFDNELQGKAQNIEFGKKDAPYNEFFCSTKAEAGKYWSAYKKGSISQGMSYAKSSDYNSIFDIDSPKFEGTYAYNLAVAD